MIKRSRVLPVAVLSLVGLLAAGCSGPNTTATAETTAVRRAEALVASYAPAHLGEDGVGTPAGCEDRIIGESPTSDSARELYLELLCSSLPGHPSCSRTDSTAFLLEAMASISKQSRVTALLLDTDDDAAEYQWVVKHFPAEWRHVESNGPKYGQLLQSRLDARFPC